MKRKARMSLMVKRAVMKCLKVKTVLRREVKLMTRMDLMR